MPNGSHILANGCGAINIVRITTIGIDRFTRIARINRINGIEEINANGRDRWDQRQWMDGRGEKFFRPYRLSCYRRPLRPRRTDIVATVCTVPVPSAARAVWSV